MSRRGDVKVSEDNAWRTYRDDTRHLRKGGDLHRVRIENGVESATPDTNEAFRGSTWWGEWKTAARPCKPETPVEIDWRPGQQEWLWRRSRAGGKAYLFIQIGSGTGRARYVIGGEHAPDLTAPTERRLLELSLVEPTATSEEMLMAAAGFWTG
jgi:hypothetical protein